MPSLHFRPLALLLLTVLSLGAFPVLAVDGDALLRQVDRKMQPEAYEMYRKLINVDPNGNKK